MKTTLTTLISALCLSVAFAGQQSAPPSPTKAPEKTELSAEKLMEMTQDARCKQILVTGLINGQPVKLMLDTGATHTVLHTGSAEKLKGVQWIDTSALLFRGNSSQRPKMLIASLQVGPGESPTHPINVMDLSGVRSMMAEPDTLDGIVGMDLLSSLPFVFDFAKKEYYWGMPKRGPLVKLEGDRDASGRLTFPVTSGDKTFKLLLDTGSSITRIQKANWAPGDGEMIAAQISDVDATARITTLEGKAGPLQLAKGVVAENLTPLLCDDKEATILGIDALTGTALVHLPIPNEPHGAFFVIPQKQP
ncbi:MAG: clan AA aspartic protease [Kiritimatiellae bacterium]|nr:clan AA aspartic protease [Kiritimatiellia bacterium]